MNDNYYACAVVLDLNEAFSLTSLYPFGTLTLWCNYYPHPQSFTSKISAIYTN